jgi:antitoxin component YwqK of YwqJK toxin-antitoxin module
MKKLALIQLLLVALIFVSCNGQETSNNSGVEIKKKYYESGALEFEVTLENGVFHGPSKKYYESGKLMNLVQFQNGVRIGESIIYYETGPVMIKENYNEKGEHDGVYQEFHENKQKALNGTFKDGEREGEWL